MVWFRRLYAGLYHRLIGGSARGLTGIIWLLAIPVSLSGAEAPARYLDLSLWKLMLPIDTDRSGRADEIRQPELNSFLDSRYFFVNDRADGVVFRAHCGGSTSKGSKYPRSELREMRNGKSPAAWATDDGGVHTMTMTAAITKTPPVKKHVVCAQIHDATDDVIMVRLEGKKLMVERNTHGDVLLDSTYTLGTPFKLKVQSGDGHVKVWHNNVLKFDWEVSRSGCYFKAGCYTQSNLEKGDAPDAYGEVVIYQLQVEHQERP